MKWSYPTARTWLAAVATLLATISAPVTLMTSMGACGTDRPPPAGDDTTSGPGANGPCVEGTTQSCHVTLGVNNGILSCFAGTQTCTSGAWGICGGAGTLSGKAFDGVWLGSPTGLKTQALSTPTTCATNPCDPYCSSYNEDAGYVPEGSSTVIAITGPTLASSNVPPGFQNKGVDPDNVCAGCSSTNTTPACQAACQFDEHCNWLPDGGANAAATGANSNKCVDFNVLQQGACTGLDITSPVACNSATGRVLTVCNRGTVAAQPGIHCYAFPGNSPQFPNYPDASPTGTGTLVMTTATTIQPGRCESQDILDSVFPSNGTESLLCNPVGDGLTTTVTTQPASGNNFATTTPSAGSWTNTNQAYQVGSGSASLALTTTTATPSGGNGSPSSSTAGSSTDWSNIANILGAPDGFNATVRIGDVSAAPAVDKNAGTATVNTGTWSGSGAAATGASNGVFTTATLPVTTLTAPPTTVTNTPPSGGTATTWANSGNTFASDNVSATVSPGKSGTKYPVASNGVTGPWQNVSNAYVKEAVPQVATATMAGQTDILYAVANGASTCDSAGCGAWATPGQALGGPNGPAAANLASATEGANNGATMTLGSYDFTGANAIPAGATISQVKAVVRVGASKSDAKCKVGLALAGAAGVVGAEQQTSGLTLWTAATPATGILTLTWGAGGTAFTNVPTAADIASATFVKLHALDAAGGGGCTVYVDSVSLQVTYQYTSATAMFLGFSLPSVPAGATITALTVNVRMGASAANANGSISYQPYRNARTTAIGTLKTVTNPPTALTVDSTSFSVAGLTGADLDDTNFGVKISIANAANTAQAAWVTQIDYVEVVVSYSSNEYLTVSGFDFSSIPAGSTIISVATETAWMIDQAGDTNATLGMQAYSNTTQTAALGSELTTGASPPSALTPVSNTLSPVPTLAQLSSGGFNVRLRASRSTATASNPDFTASVDYVRVKVVYSGAPTASLTLNNFGFSIPATATTVSLTFTAGINSAASNAQGQMGFSVQDSTGAVLCSVSTFNYGTAATPSCTASPTAAQLNGLQVVATASFNGTPSASFTPGIDYVLAHVTYNTTAANPQTITLQNLNLQNLVPAGAQIESIQTDVTWKCQTGNRDSLKIEPRTGTTDIGTPVTVTPNNCASAATSTQTYTNTSGTITYNDLSNANFNVLLTASTTAAGGDSAVSFDGVKVTVVYSTVASSTMEVGGFGFGVPSGASSVNVTVGVDWDVSAASTATQLCFQGYNGATALGAQTCTTAGVSPPTSFGGATTPRATVTLSGVSAADANNLTVKVTGTRSAGGTATTANVDYVDAVASYTVVGGTVQNECNPFNNWSVEKKNPAEACRNVTVGSFATTTYSQSYAPTCLPGTRLQWGYLTYNATTPKDPTTGSQSTVTLQVQATPNSPDGGGPSSQITVANVPTPDPNSCPMTGVAGCPKNLYTLLGSYAQDTSLTLTVTLTPTNGGAYGPTLDNYNITYDCVPYE